VLVYGDARDRVKTVPYVLFTEARRDVVWAGAPLVARVAAGVVPETERALFEDPSAFWAAYENQRFHDYSQVNTKVLRGSGACVVIYVASCSKSHQLNGL